MPLSNGKLSRIAVFDCDGTIIKGDVGEAMFRFQVEHFLFRESPGEIWTEHPLRTELHDLYRSLSSSPPLLRTHDPGAARFAELLYSWYFAKISEGKTESACSDIVRLFAGFSNDELREIAADTVRHERLAPCEETNAESLQLPRGIRYVREVCLLMEWLRNRDFNIWVVSGSNRWSVEEVCRPLSIPASNVLGIDLLATQGFYTPHVVRPVPVLEGKVRALETRSTPPPSIVVSDSLTDLPLFRYATGLRVFVATGMSASRFRTASGFEMDDRLVILDSLTFE